MAPNRRGKARPSPVIARIRNRLRDPESAWRGVLASERTKASEWTKAWFVEPPVEWAEERRRNGSTLDLLPVVGRLPRLVQNGSGFEGIST